MATILLGNWWALALRGAIAILFGLAAFLLPGITAAALVLLFAVYAVVDGILAIVAGIRAARQHGRSWPLLLEGVLDIAAGVIAFLWPGLTLLVLITLIAIWAIVTGIALLAGAIVLRRSHGEWLLIVNGILSIILGVVLFLEPIAGVLVLAWWVGAYAILFGITLLVVAFRLRRRRLPA